MLDHSPHGCSVQIPGDGGLGVRADVLVPPETAADWRYADPDGTGHDVLNCSIAAVELTVAPHRGAPPVRIASRHGGVYELGTRT